jgi:hypothetical protein
VGDALRELDKLLRPHRDEKGKEEEKLAHTFITGGTIYPLYDHIKGANPQAALGVSMKKFGRVVPPRRTYNEREAKRWQEETGNEAE